MATKKADVDLLDNYIHNLQLITNNDNYIHYSKNKKLEYLQLNAVTVLVMVKN